MFKKQLSIIFVVVLFLMGNTVALASVVTGTISTEGIVIIVPTATPPADVVYNSAQIITLTASGEPSIRYTIDGSKPNCSTSTLYSTAITVSVSQVIQALSCYAGNISSAVATFGYVINPPAPAPSGSGSSGSGGGGGGGITTTNTTADPNGDGKVDIFDFNILMIHWGTVPSGGSSADFNNDGVIDIFDFNLLMINWTG